MAENACTAPWPNLSCGLPMADWELLRDGDLLLPSLFIPGTYGERAAHQLLHIAMAVLTAAVLQAVGSITTLSAC